MTNKEYIKAYTEYITFEKGLSKNTIKNYLKDIFKLEELNNLRPFNKIEIDNIRKNISSLHSKGLNGKSLSRMLSSWRGFYEFLINRFNFIKNPIIGIKAPKSSKKLPQIVPGTPPKDTQKNNAEKIQKNRKSVHLLYIFKGNV